MTKLDRADEAKQTLEKIAWQVEPIMRAHQWRVPVLREFLPRSPNLLGLNVNKGAEIKVRLRKTKDGDFFDFNHSLGTMLHELCHCEHGAPANYCSTHAVRRVW